PADHACGDGPSHTVPTELREQVGRVADLRTIELEQNVAQQDAVAVRRPAWFHARDQQPDGVRQLEPAGERLWNTHGLCPDPKISAPDRPPFQELRRGAIDGRDRNYHRRAPSQPGRVDPEHSPGRINERAAGKAVVDGQIQPQERVDLATLPGSPRTGDAAHDAPAGGEPCSGTPERNHQLPNSGRSVAPETGARQALARKLQHREVGTWVAPGERGRSACPVGQGHRDVVVASDGVIRGDDHSRPPGDSARRYATPRLDRDDGAAGRLYGGGKFI